MALDLVVRDRRGNAIRDLRPDEVEVYEDGVRQPVSEFRVVPFGREAPADGLRRRPRIVPALRPATGPGRRRGRTGA